MSKPTYVDDYKAIEAVLQLYVEGCKQAKSELMKPAFSESATMFSVDENNNLSGGAIQGLFDLVDAHFQPSEPTSVISGIQISGTAASARLDTDNLCGFGFTDYFHLLKINGKWKIVSKIFHTNYTP